jgi:hypothetical protein
MEILTGFILVILSGLGIGTTAWPFKVLRDIHFEQYLFIYMLTGIVILPWVIVWLNIPDLIAVIKSVGLKPLLISNLLSMSWGVANVLYLVCVVKIGAALTGAILSALGMSVGVIMPMIIKGSGSFGNAPDLLSKAGVLIFTGLIVMVIGIMFVSMAGFEREKVLKAENSPLKDGQPSGKFLQGLVLVVLAGILSCGLSLAFVYSQGPVIEAVEQQGVGEITANIAVWALGILGGALVNIFYAGYWMTRKKTWNLLFIRKGELVFGTLAGLQFIISIVFMGRGMVLLGVLGASVGFGIQQSLQITGNQLVGFIGREWKGINGKPRRTMYLGLAIILIAVIIFSYCK